VRWRLFIHTGPIDPGIIPGASAISDGLQRGGVSSRRRGRRIRANDRRTARRLARGGTYVQEFLQIGARRMTGPSAGAQV